MNTLWCAAVCFYSGLLAMRLVPRPSPDIKAQLIVEGRGQEGWAEEWIIIAITIHCQAFRTFEESNHIASFAETYMRHCANEQRLSHFGSDCTTFENKPVTPTIGHSGWRCLLSNPSLPLVMKSRSMHHLLFNKVLNRDINCWLAIMQCRDPNYKGVVAMLM